MSNTSLTTTLFVAAELVGDFEGVPLTVMEFSCRWEQTQENESATIWKQEVHWKTRGAGVSSAGVGSCCSGLVVPCSVVILVALRICGNQH